MVEGEDRRTEVLVTRLLMSQGDCEPLLLGYFPTGCLGSHASHPENPGEAAS